VCFEELLLASPGVESAVLDSEAALLAARLRAEHGLALADALLAATAITTACDALLTNDAVFSRVPGLRVLCIDDFREPLPTPR